MDNFCRLGETDLMLRHARLLLARSYCHVMTRGNNRYRFSRYSRLSTLPLLGEPV
jgi:hypothetical protein